MTKYYWKYAQLLKKNTSAGSIFVDVFSGQQQLVKPLIVVVKAVSGDNDGGTSESDVSLTMATTGTNKNFMNKTTEGTLILPSKDDLQKFKTLDIGNFILGDGDKITLRRSHIGVNGTVVVEIRALISTYALPTVTLGVFIENSNLYFNNIVGEVEN